MTHHRTRDCAFTTSRLEVGPWHDIGDRDGIDLIAAITTILTERTTDALPPDWQGDFDDDRARGWMSSRDVESPTLLVIERATGHPVGLVILFEAESGQGESNGVDVRLGYVFEESAWGQGFASELVSGLVNWAHRQSGIDSISGGVVDGNDASAKALLKNGFRATASYGGEQIYRHTID